MKRSYDQSLPRRMYRNPEHRVILGVCAGIADYFGWPRWLTRVAAVVLGWLFTIPVIAAYFIAALLMPERPLRDYGHDDGRGFWRSHRHRS
jgi:phage shock protein C